MLEQATIKYPINISGIGLHNGKRVCCHLQPAPPNSGIIFRRTDLNPPVEFSVSPDLVKETTLCTTIVKDGHKVATIEHMMSALYGLGIDNIIVDINAPELPILDGSAAEFIFILQSAGVYPQGERKKFVRILDTVRVEDEKGGWAMIEPHEGFKLSFSVDFNHTSLRNQSSTFTVDFSSTSFLKEVSRARTFGFLEDVDYLRKNNMALGGGVHNAIVLDADGPINKEGFRVQGEHVRHKVLDVVGDLYVFGHCIIGCYTAHKSGHSLNNALLHKIINNKKTWEFVQFEKIEDIPINFLHSKVA